MIGGGAARAGAWRRRANTILRVLTAIPGGYLVASLWGMALARLLPGGPLQASMAAMILSFALCAAIAMWAFAARSGWRAMWTVLLAGAVAAIITAVSIHLTGRA